MKMKRSASAVLLAAALCFCAHDAHAASKTVDLTTLILTVPGYPSYDHAETVLRAYGAPFDVVRLDASALGTLNVTAMLTNDNSSGKYAFIIVAQPNIINIWGGVLNLDQVNAVYAYQEAFGARLVLEGPYVGAGVATDIPGGPLGVGVQYANSGSPYTPSGAGIVATTAPLTVSGVKAGAPLDYSGLYLTPVTITDANRTKAVLTCSSPSSHAGVAAVTSKFPSGREQWTSFFPCAAFSSDCLLVAHLYLAWGLHGILPGARDSLLSVQVDDLFLKTGEPFDETAQYRMNVADSRSIASFASNVPNLPAGSDFKVEFVYNNGGYMEESQPGPYFEAFPDTFAALAHSVSTLYYKVPGVGDDLMAPNPDISWWDPAVWRAKDALFNEIAYGPSGMQFYLGHHTFTHLNHNNITYNDALQQIRLNQAAAASWNTTNGDFDRFSETTMVTPAISGMRNVEALQALMDAGITAAVGDSSWPHLRNQLNPWQAQVTSSAPRESGGNGTVDGFYIIPRSPTEIYYDVSTEAVETQFYNYLYCCSDATCPANACSPGKPFTAPSTWADILNREKVRVTRLMLALRPEGHMFHQANCRYGPQVGPSGKSLLEQWTAAVVEAYSQRVTWPLITLKLDDQLAFAKKRIERDACGLKYRLTYDDDTKSASALTISSSAGGCVAPVMIGSPDVTGADAARELGNEPLLYTTAVAAGSSKTLVLGSDIKWA